MSIIQQIFKQELALDIETLSTSRGSGILELATFDRSKKKLTQFRLSPNLIVPKAATLQDVTGLRTSSRDILTTHPLLAKVETLRTKGKKIRSINWRDTIIAQVLMDETLGETGVFSSKIKGAFHGKKFPGLSVQAVQDMNEKDFMIYVKAVQDISDKAAKGGSGLSFFQAGVEESSPFLRRALKERFAGIIDGKTDPQAEEKHLRSYAKKLGYKDADKLIVETVNLTPEELLDPNGRFLNAMRGKNVQIANVAFESKQIGALVSAMEANYNQQYMSGIISKEQLAQKLVKVSGIRKVLAETPVGISDIMPISGAEVNRARTKAQITGDYTGLFRPMLDEMASGKHARTSDILDLFKVQESYAQKVGLRQKGAINIMSVDVAQRLYGFAETIDPKALSIKELHEAGADVLSQSKLSRSVLSQAYALEQVDKGSFYGKKLIQEAKKGGGDLYRAIALERIRGHAKGFVEESNVMTRLGRAAQNILSQGVSPETSGTFRKAGGALRMTPEGKTLRVPRVIPGDTFRLGNLDQVLSHIKSQSAYRNADMDKAVGLFVGQVNKAAGSQAISFDTETQKFAYGAGYEKLTAGDFKSLENAKKQYIEQGFTQLAESVQRGEVHGLTKKSIVSQAIGLERQILQGKSLISRIGAPSLLSAKSVRSAGMIMTGLGVMGAVLGQSNGDEQLTESLRYMDYQRWYEANSQFFGMEQSNTGMKENGIGAGLRKQMTDFGSPYQGPTISQYILEQQDLLRQRQAYLRTQFSNTHYSLNASPMSNMGQSRPLSGLARAFKMTNGIIKQGNPLVQEGQYVSSRGYSGMSGKDLFKVDLSKYKMTATDADTILLKRKGITNSLKSFFGMNQNISIRLAGIDAPETAHGGNKAMPLAQQSLGRLKALMSRGKLELMVDPNDITYGRQVGSLFTNGKNIQADLLKSGMAQQFKDKKGGMVNNSTFSRLNQLASARGAGMHSNPYFQPMLDYAKQTGNSVTFTTFQNERKMAKSASLMSIHSIMKASEKAGTYSNLMQDEIRNVARSGSLHPDYQSKSTYSSVNAPHKAYIDYLAADNARLMQTRGKKSSHTAQRSSGYGKLDKKLSLDTMGTSTSSHNKRRYHAFEQFDTIDRVNKMRKLRMQELQKKALRELNESPIGHHRM